MSIRQQIIDSLKARLETISKSAGYLTNAGSAVYLWRRTPIGSEQFPCLLVIDRELQRNQDKFGAEQVENVLTVEVIAYAVDKQLGSAEQIRLVEEDLIKCLGDWQETEQVFDWLYVAKTSLVLEDHEVEYAAIQATVIIEYDTAHNQC